MAFDDHTVVKDWTEDDLLDIPHVETDDYEYKSSRIRETQNYRTELKHKLCKAASAFWNTGGGIFIAGVDDEGEIDGGLPYRMGRQKLRDWVDQALSSVVPSGPYTVKMIKPERPDSKIELGHVVLVVAFGESFDVPHMAHDNRYYVRAGGHSNPANHYLVEAIRARRGLQRPMLRGLLREHPLKPDVVELLIAAVNTIPALNVSFTFDPLPHLLADDHAERFPLKVPLIDLNTPFRMNISSFYFTDDWFSETPVYLKLTYQGVMGKEYADTQLLDPHTSLSPLRLANHGQTPETTLQQIAQQLDRFNELVESFMRVRHEP